MSSTAQTGETTSPESGPSPADDRSWLRHVPAVLPGLMVVAVALVMALLDGGFEPTIWYPAGLFLIALLASAVVAAPPRRSDRSPLTSVALVLFALLAAWALLSITWADAPGPAWDGANRMLLYLAALLIICLRRWSYRDAMVAIAMVATVVTATAVWLMVKAALASDPSSLFIQGRLASPIGYLNATANLWLMGFFPALHLALSRSLPTAVRAVAFGATTLLLQVILLSQSRGAAIAIVATTIVYVAFTPRRAVATAALATVIGFAVIASGPILDIRRSVVAGGFAPAVDDATKYMAITVIAAIAIAVVAILIAGRLASRVDGSRPLRLAGNVGVGALGAGLLVAALVAVGSPGAWTQARWDDFKNSGYEEVDASSTRFAGSLGSGRYDYWRVALNEFKARPVTGIGADNFASEYLADRRTIEAPRYPHSIAVMAISQLGVVGAALMGGFFLLLLIAAVKARRAVGREHGAVIAALVAAGVVWFVHALGDWLWEFPALGLLGLSMFAIAARSSAVDEGDARGVHAAGAVAPVVGSLPGRIVLAVLALAAAVSLSIPGVAARYLSAAYADSGANPQASIERLGRAAEINPLDSEALVAKGVVAQRAGRLPVAIDAFRQAVERDPENWFAHLELGLVLAAAGQSSQAEASVRTALELNPGQPLTREVLRVVRRGEAVSAEEIEQRLTEVLERSLSVTDPTAATGAG